MKKYTVQKRDCLSSIAASNGLADYRAIYDHPENAAFKAQRPNPNVIYAGDVVLIPDKEIKTVDASTDMLHRFQLNTAKTRFRVRIQFNVPFTYHLVIDGTAFDGTLEDGEIIDVPIAPDAQNGKLSIWPNSEMKDDPLEFDVTLGDLDPIDEVSGVQARLRNLGFDCRAIDGVIGSRTERALRAFQNFAELEVTGRIDAPTRDALLLRHDIA